MDVARKPETMTDAERRRELASILAGGLLRSIRHARSCRSRAIEKVSEAGDSGLDPFEHAVASCVRVRHGGALLSSTQGHGLANTSRQLREDSPDVGNFAANVGNCWRRAA